MEPQESLRHKGYYHIPLFMEYVVDRKGNVISDTTGDKVPSWLDKKSNKIKVCLNKNNEKFYTTVSLVLAKTFIPVPENLKDKKIIIGRKDSSSTFEDLENLEWTTQRDFQNKLYVDRITDLVKRFSIPSFNKVRNGLFPNAIECRHKKGYYFIPFIKLPIVINENGEMFNLETNEKHPTNKDKKGYIKTSIVVDGKSKTIAVHRVVALLFVARPDRHKEIEFDFLQVNHKDGKKENNHFSNLEWVTNSENMEHAIENALFSNRKPILAKSLETGEIVYFKSGSEVAKVFNVSNDSIKIRSSGIYSGRIPLDGYVLKEDNDESWPAIILQETEIDNRDRVDPVIFKHSEGKVFLFNSLKSGCYYLGLDLIRMKNLNQQNKDYFGWKSCSYKRHLELE